jgi:hypothetical protein
VESKLTLSTSGKEGAVAGRVPRSLTVAVVLCAVVAAGALAGAAAVRLRAGGSAAAPVTSEKSEPTGGVGVSGCRIEPCQVLATASVGGTRVELVADAGGTSGRLRIGGPSTGQVIETTTTEMGVALTSSSLQCLPGGPAACLVRGDHAEGTAGQVVVGRSGNWSALEKPYVSSAGYLGLANVNDDSAPEVIAAQYDCAGAADCSRRPVFAQVFALNGAELGCTKNYQKVDKLPGHPLVALTKAQLTPCR